MSMDRDGGLPTWTDLLRARQMNDSIHVTRVEDFPVARHGHAVRVSLKSSSSRLYVIENR